MEISKAPGLIRLDPRLIPRWSSDTWKGTPYFTANDCTAERGVVFKAELARAMVCGLWISVIVCQHTIAKELLIAYTLDIGLV